MNLLPAILPVGALRASAQPPIQAFAAFEVQAVARADAAVLMALCDAQRAECGAGRAAAYGTENDGVLELMEALFEPPLRAWAWLVRARGAAIGYAAATVGFSMLERAYYLRLESLYLDAAWRGHGAEADLLAAAHLTAQRLGCTNLQWQDGPHLHRIEAEQAVPVRAVAYVLPLLPAG